MDRPLAAAPRLFLAATLAVCAPGIAVTQSLQTASESQHTITAAELTPELRGDLAMAHQQYLQAIDAYTQVADKTAADWNKLGMAYHHLFAMEQARRDYEQALRLQPSYPEALNNLGAVYYAKKNYGKAIRYYHKALQYDPKSAPVYSNLGTAWFARGKVQQGIEAYRTAFALDPKVFSTDSSLLVNEELPAHDRAQQDFCLALLFAESGKNQQAIEYLRKALDEGFSDRRKILEDQTLAALRTTPEFAELMTEQRISLTSAR
jgi:tetratricopeptide (TPR) repeat protein